MNDTQIKILASPAHNNRHMNPHQHLLYSELENSGAVVVEFGFNRQLLCRYDIFHIHWPELIVMRKSRTDSWLHLAAFIAFLLLCKLRGTRIVWTVNNLKAHDAGNTVIDRMLWHVFPRMVDFYITLSAPTRTEVLNAYPFMRATRGAVIPRGHYRDSYPDEVSRAEARRRLGLPEHAKVLAYIGLIRPYKNVPKLISVFKATRDTDLRLVIAGKCSHWHLEEEIRAQAAGDARIHFLNQFIPDDELQYMLKAADAVVLPYRDILNSGSALLALSFHRPVILPRLGSNLELEDEFGDRWVKLYSPELTQEFLETAVAEAQSMHDMSLDMRHRDWPQVADRVMAAYREIVSPRSL